jgi:hypothetical protein
VVAADVEAVAGRMRTTGAPFRLDPPNDVLSFPRLWVGFSSDHPDRYDPAADAGIRIEVIPFDVLRLPTGLPTAPSPAGGGSPVRIAARTLFVSDLGDALRVLDRNFGFAPAGPVIKSQDGLRRARMPFPHINSAEVELVEVGAGATGPEADFGAEWGPGPWSVRIEVDDLDALVKRFDGRGIPWHRLPPAEPGGPERVLRPAEWDLGTAFEFVELA